MIDSEKHIQIQLADKLIRSGAWRSGHWRHVMWNVELPAGVCDEREKKKVFADLVFYNEKYNPILVVELKKWANTHRCMEALGQLHYYCFALNIPIARAMLCVPNTWGIPDEIGLCFKKQGIGITNPHWIVSDIDSHLSQLNALPGDSDGNKGTAACQSQSL